jgi:hypothetical protein
MAIPVFMAIREQSAQDLSIFLACCCYIAGMTKLLAPDRTEKLAQGLARELAQVDDLSHMARRLSFVRDTFQREAERMARRNGLVCMVDERRLARAFVQWRHRFDALKHEADQDRAGFIRRAAAMMAEELLRLKALDVRALPSRSTGQELAPATDPIVAFWPEGAIVMDYCLAVAIALLRHDGEDILQSPKAQDLRVWWSFRESVAEDVAVTRPFFDLLLGRKPDWLGEAARLPETPSDESSQLMEPPGQL